MAEWTEASRNDYKAFLDKHKTISDPIERALVDIEIALLNAWKGNRCLVCPIAELSAIAAATRSFYVENRSVNGAAKK